MALFKRAFGANQALFSPSIVDCGWKRYKGKGNGACLRSEASFWWWNGVPKNSILGFFAKNEEVIECIAP
jgi:hypothetical protein